MKKKLLILSACIGLILACFPFTLCAEEDPQSDLGVSSPPAYYLLDSYFYDNYDLLPYIESDGSQYINTGINASNHLKVEFSVSDITVSPSAYFFGGGDYANQNILAIGLGPADANGKSRFKFYRNDFDYTLNYVDYYIYNFKFDQNIAYLNGNVVHEWTDNTFSSNTMDIFGINLSAGHSNRIACKLYKFSIYDYSSDEYVRYYYPAKAKSGGTIGLYDSVSKTFVTTLGSDPFESPTNDHVIGFQISAFITAGLDWIGDILDFAISEPVIILFMAIGLAGAMFRWGRRLVHF